MEMPTPNTEITSDLEMSTISMNVVPSTDNVTSLILMNPSDVEMDTFTTLPIDFESSNSSLGTLISVDESLKDDSIPMLTDIAEETVYDTEEFFDETPKMDEKSDSCDFSGEKHIITSCVDDISSVLIDSSIVECEARVDDVKIDISGDIDFKEDLICIEDDKIINSTYLSANNGVFMSSTAPSISDVSNMITISNNTNLASGILEIAQDDSTSDGRVEIVSANSSSMFASIPNVIQMNSGSNPKLPSYKPITLQSTSKKFVPINIAPNPTKRPGSISVGQPSSNVLTKVIVTQGKVGQPYVITNAPKPKSICVLNPSAAAASPVKSITVAQAKQMGIKLHPLKPSISKPLKQKFIISNTTPGAQVLKKIQPVQKTATPTKILPAPLVSKPATSGQPTKIFVSQDYVMKGGALVPKQAGGQVIALSNLQSGSVVSNHVSPKKQVQYIKLINNVGSTNVPTVTTSKGKLPVTQNAAVGTIDQDTPIIMASGSISGTNLNLTGTTSAQTSKSAPPSNITVLPVIPPTSVKTIPGQRLILPAVSKSKAENNSQQLLTDTNQLQTPGSIVVLHDNIMEKIKEDLLPNSQAKLKEDSKIIHIDNSKINHDSQDNMSDFRSSAKSPTKHLTPSFETGNGLRSRKPCNCTRSQCLKLYCECFANGEFCNNCNCVSCHNNISHEENRQHAIKSCLDRNPQAFRPKIGKCVVGLSDRRHTKGCHCKRSGCLKNYCECYEAQIPCSDNCKCMGCKNIDEMLFAPSYSNSTSSCTVEKPESQMEFQTFSKNKLTAEINDAVGQSGTSNPRHAFSFIKDQVVEATCQCLLAQADEVKRRNINVEDGQKYILEEFGRCLIQIIECAPDKYNPS